MNKKAITVGTLVTIILALVLLVVMLSIPLYQYVNEHFFSGNLLGTAKQKLGLEKESVFRPKQDPFDEARLFCKKAIIKYKDVKENDKFDVNGAEILVKKINFDNKTVLLEKNKELREGREGGYAYFSDGLGFHVVVIRSKDLNTSLCVG